MKMFSGSMGFNIGSNINNPIIGGDERVAIEDMRNVTDTETLDVDVDEEEEKNAMAINIGSEEDPLEIPVCVVTRTCEWKTVVRNSSVIKRADDTIIAVLVNNNKTIISAAIYFKNNNAYEQFKCAKNKKCILDSPSIKSFLMNNNAKIESFVEPELNKAFILKNNYFDSELVEYRSVFKDNPEVVHLNPEILIDTYKGVIDLQ
jgi:hypothetical protein